jgi:8-oxo-dGTP pyrophosphatase MutT (NUDIX family)
MCYGRNVTEGFQFVDAAVLVPVFRDTEGELHLVMIRRAAGGLHGGQLAFPGGRPEPEDGSILDTALRESWEEIGLAPERVRVLGALPPVDTLATRYRIHPFLGLIDHPGRWVPEPAEVDDVMEIPLNHLRAPGTLQLGLQNAASWDVPRQIAFYRVGQDRLWGASFRIMRPLVRRIANGEWEV